MLTLDALRWAWLRVRQNGGAAGGDEVSLRRFARLLDANLLEMADEVRAGAYRPGRPRYVTIQSGRKTRRLAILPVRDRVLQRAALDLLGPRIDPTFLPSSFGYRPGLSLHDAVERIVRLRDLRWTWVVDADIRECFGSLDHARLVECLSPHVQEDDLMALVRAWINAPPKPRLPPRFGHPAAPSRGGLDRTTALTPDPSPAHG